MTVEHIYQRHVDLVSPFETAQVAAQRMAARNVGSLVVVDAENRPLGIVTDRDLALQVVGRDRTAREVRIQDVMSEPVETIGPLAAIEDAVARMRRNAVRRLPVVDKEGHLLGVVTLDDVLSHIASAVRDVGAVLERSSPQRLARE